MIASHASGIGVLHRTSFVIGLVIQFAVGGDPQCYVYSCSTKDISFLWGQPPYGEILRNFPHEDSCGESDPTGAPLCTSTSTVSGSGKPGGCLAMIFTFSFPLVGEIKLIAKNCSDSVVGECYQQSDGKKLAEGEAKCERVNPKEVQANTQPEQQKLQKCLKDKGVPFPIGNTGITQVGEKRPEAAEKKPKDEQTMDVCLCNGNMCNDQGKIRDAVHKLNNKELSKTPKIVSASPSLMSSFYYQNALWLLVFQMLKFTF